MTMADAISALCGLTTFEIWSWVWTSEQVKPVVDWADIFLPKHCFQNVLLFDWMSKWILPEYPVMNPFVDTYEVHGRLEAVKNRLL
jgi:hypothetical protein